MQVDPLIGREVDGYRILEVLGQGGMGVVYKVKHLALNRIEALKVIAPTLTRDDQFLRRFQLEAQALAKIQHPNIVTIHTLRQSDLGHYLTMEYVEGPTLADVILEEGAITWQRALPIVTQLLAGLEYAHDRGIIHRDIKPRNIVLTSEGVVKVMDFGLARFFQNQDVTQTRGASGTLYYMSPEQIKGAPNLDQRSDIFSLGMTIYEMLTGRLPFDKSDSQFGIQRFIIEEEFPTLNRFNKNLPAEFSKIIMKALHKEPKRRFQYAQEMREAVEIFRDNTLGREASRPSGVGSPGARRAITSSTTVSRWGRYAALIGGVGVVILGAVLLYVNLVSGSQGPLSLVEEPAYGSYDRIELIEPVEPDPVEAELVESEVRQPEARQPEVREPEPRRPEPRRTAPRRPEPDVEVAVAEEPVLEAIEAEEPLVARAAPDPRVTAARSVEADVRALRENLKRAILRRHWYGLPEPVATFYQEKFDDFSRKLTITDVGVEIDDAGFETDGQEAVLPITIRVDYRQKGRSGVKSFPIPALWTWQAADDGMRLVRVE